ncbi:DNA polymerase III subunit beta [Patescibacteria group bacterium]
MKLTTLQENLKNGLTTVNHVAGKNTNLPILNNVLIEVKDGNIKLTTTDLEIGVITTIRGKVEKEGTYTIDAKVISEFAALLPNKKVEIEKKDNKFLVKCDNYKISIKGQEAEEFPLIPTIEKEEFFSVELGALKSALTQVIFSTSAGETRVELSGVFFHINKESLTLAATDSYRLAEKTIKINTNSKEEKSVIVPARALQETLRIISNLRPGEGVEEKNEIKFYLSENQILFSLGNTELVSRLIEGQYPDYRQIIPTTHQTSALVSRGEFIRAVKASSIFSKTGINDINLDFPLGKNTVIISSASGQTGESVVELSAKVSGVDNGIVMNYRYLLDGLNNIEGDNIKIEVTNGNTPCAFKPEKDEDYLYIVMPIKQ